MYLQYIILHGIILSRKIPGGKPMFYKILRWCLAGAITVQLLHHFLIGSEMNRFLQALNLGVMVYAMITLPNEEKEKVQKIIRGLKATVRVYERVYLLGLNRDEVETLTMLMYHFKNKQSEKLSSLRGVANEKVSRLFEQWEEEQ